MTIKTKIAITATAFCLAFTANAAVQRDPYDVAEGSVLDNVARTLETGMKRVEKVYKNKKGDALPAARVLIDGTVGVTGGVNPYIEKMEIGTDYILAIKLHDAAITSAATVQTAGVAAIADFPPTLSGIKIAMVPIYKTGNKKITGWECITDADEVKNEVLGEKKPVVGGVSYISNLTNYNFLGNCRYAETANVPAPA